MPSIDARMVARPGMAHGTGRRARGSYSALRRVLMALCVSACWTDEKVEGEEGDKKHEHHAPRPGRPGSRCKQQPPGSSCLPAAAAAAAVLQQQWPWLHVQQPCRRPGLQSPALTSAARTPPKAQVKWRPTRGLWRAGGRSGTSGAGGTLTPGPSAWSAASAVSSRGKHNIVMLLCDIVIAGERSACFGVVDLSS